MITEKVFFPNNLHQRLAGKLYRDDVPSQRGVIFCHGLFSTKDGYKITSLAGDIVAGGFTLFTFDFSFVGESGGRLEDLSILQEVRDLEYAADFFLGTGIDEFHLMGSSMGGVVSLLYCAGNPGRMDTLTLIATPLDLRTLLEKHAAISDIESLPLAGTTSIEGIPVKNSFFREAAAFDLEAAATAVRVPALIVHGAVDAVVDVSDAFRLGALLRGDRKLVISGDGDHHLTRPADIDRLRKEILQHLSNFGS